MGVLWVGHEAECYVLGGANNTESTGASDSYERTGMRAGRAGAGSLYSSPDWAAVDEIWHRWLHQDGNYSGETFWQAVNASGVALAQIIVSGSSQAQFQIWSGTAWTSIGTPFNLVGTGVIGRFDVHLKGGTSGQATIYYGAPGSQTKVVDATGAYTAVTGIVRIFHGTNNNGPLNYDSDVGHEVVQTTGTLGTKSEAKPPTADGTDIDGGAGGYANVNEQTYNDANYVALAASGNHQSFTAAARTLTQAIVSGVTASARALYESGGPSSMKPYLKISGTRYYGPTFALGLTAAGYQYTWQTNPATGVAFTPAEANAAAMEWGWEAV